MKEENYCNNHEEYEDGDDVDRIVKKLKQKHFVLP